MAVPSLGGALGVAPLPCGGLGQHAECQGKPQPLGGFIGRVLQAPPKMGPESSTQGLNSVSGGYHASLDIQDPERVHLGTEEKDIRYRTGRCKARPSLRP